MTSTAFKILCISFFSYKAFAHGENKYGPNNGYIKMPGSFHTELALATRSSFNIYLLNLSNKKPVVENSSVALTYKNGDKSFDFSCAPVEDYFYCKTTENFSVKEGRLILNATRSGKKGMEVAYDLPLSLAGITPKDVGESQGNSHDTGKMNH